MGWFVCKTIPYLQGVSVNASINTLVAISAERCVAICYPMKWHITSRVVRYAVFIIWLLSLSITLPWALYFQLKPLEQGSQYLVSEYFLASIIPLLPRGLVEDGGIILSYPFTRVPQFPRNIFIFWRHTKNKDIIKNYDNSWKSVMDARDFPHNSYHICVSI